MSRLCFSYLPPSFCKKCVAIRRELWYNGCMIKFDEEGLHFDVDLNEDDFKALEAYVAAVRVDERIRLIRFLDTTIPRPEATEETPVEEVAEVAEPTND